MDGDEATKERDSTSQDSGIQSSLPDVRSESPLNHHRAAYKPANYSTPTHSSLLHSQHSTNIGGASAAAPVCTRIVSSTYFTSFIVLVNAFVL